MAINNIRQSLIGKHENPTKTLSTVCREEEYAIEWVAWVLSKAVDSVNKSKINTFEKH